MSFNPHSPFSKPEEAERSQLMMQKKYAPLSDQELESKFHAETELLVAFDAASTLRAELSVCWAEFFVRRLDLLSQ